MSRYDYERAKALDYADEPFAALIMAAFRRADTDNSARLEAAFPEIVAEHRSRYCTPGGLLPEEAARYAAQDAARASITAVIQHKETDR